MLVRNVCKLLVMEINTGLQLHLQLYTMSVEFLPIYKFPEEFDICHAPNYWANEECALRLVRNIIIPYVNVARKRLEKPDQKVLVLYNVFKVQQLTALIHLENNGVLYVHVPNCCTHQLQPLDTLVNKAVKSFLRESFFLFGIAKKKETDG